MTLLTYREHRDDKHAARAPQSTNNKSQTKFSTDIEIETTYKYICMYLN